jgi:hypothetical protein
MTEKDYRSLQEITLVLYGFLLGGLLGLAFLLRQ